MTLYINTTQNNLIEISLKDKNKLVAVKKIKSHRTQAEKLLPAIEKLLKANKLKLSNLRNIEVENQAGSFTCLRIGVVTANALAYALGIPVAGTGSQELKAKSQKFSVVEPIYDKEPEITAKKHFS
ncbi:tRNA (adenosine(37)-N6)-threonylcarbamoyltransferase complex dimerization subunit type 1 TsaB [Patescibacteria group bacterium]|nr:tRNA (adenosine(37)-N6)-threonylcarbamoyltransferase complex dimerization subunit type 1 TsaB [Patescibacteria group bacterium]MBU1663209.1 tRNA (adenosine(37)-N6)-threonylcarbamoyltransferase complex dimerization subunit type 1 TsaB [Patescibacteria group bacterium]MBU1933767.1 tRNA (adenosine(37)-N6)-threonylcarbamoyltransferase complex dimerization subunit type 1 TsaB [Patescibacteria group bacterium]MBU2007497.1 tRNA (adenosine(37)-N6)-threonylcarbamoyltransferase complex dimerization sub